LAHEKNVGKKGKKNHGREKALLIRGNSLNITFVTVGGGGEVSKRREETYIDPA